MGLSLLEMTSECSRVVRGTPGTGGISETRLDWEDPFPVEPGLQTRLDREELFSGRGGS